jgi:minor histocompatibility antigen H13
MSPNKYLVKTATECSKSYFIAVNIGYVIAIITTTIVMIVFDHGQPALLYLVPGTIICVSLNAMCKGEWALLWEHNEEEYISVPTEEEEVEADTSVADNKVKAE